MWLSQFPNEVLQLVFYSLEEYWQPFYKGHLRAVALVSQRFNRLALPALYDKIKLELPIKEHSPLLRTFKEHPNLRLYVRNICLERCCRYTYACIFNDIADEDGIEVFHQARKFLKDLPALQSISLFDILLENTSLSIFDDVTPRLRRVHVISSSRSLVPEFIKAISTPRYARIRSGSGNAGEHGLPKSELLEWSNDAVSRGIPNGLDRWLTISKTNPNVHGALNLPYNPFQATAPILLTLVELRLYGLGAGSKALFNGAIDYTCFVNLNWLAADSSCCFTPAEHKLAERCGFYKRLPSKLKGLTIDFASDCFAVQELDNSPTLNRGTSSYLWLLELAENKMERLCDLKFVDLRERPLYIYDPRITQAEWTYPEDVSQLYKKAEINLLVVVRKPKTATSPVLGLGP